MEKQGVEDDQRTEKNYEIGKNTCLLQKAYGTRRFVTQFAYSFRLRVYDQGDLLRERP